MYNALFRYLVPMSFLWVAICPARADVVFGIHIDPSSIEYGNLTLLPDTANQIVPITINGVGCGVIPNIQGIDLRLQIGDGGMVLGGTDVGAPNAGANLPGLVSFEGFASGPVFSVSSASSIFDGGSLTGLMANSNGVSGETEAISGHGSLSAPLTKNLFGGWNIVTSGGSVEADGFVGNLVLDTTGITTQTTFTIQIENATAGFETVYNPGTVSPCGVVPGNFTVTAVPEPSAFLYFVLVGTIFAGRTYFFRNRELNVHFRFFKQQQISSDSRLCHDTAAS